MAHILRLFIAAAVTAGTTITAGAAAAPCSSRPAIGFACRDGDLLRIRLADGVTILTHGGDPVPGSAEVGSFTDPVQPACVGDRARELHGLVIYVHASDTTNREATMRGTVADLVARANGMLRAEAATFGRTLDYRMACEGDGSLLVDAVTLATPLSATTFTTVVNDLRAAGYVDSLAKYWIFFDGRPPNAPGGTGTFQVNDRLEGSNTNNWGPSYGVTWGYTGAGGAKVMMHENGHNLGAVQNTAPNTSGAGHCNDGRDVMCYADGGPASRYDGTVCSVQRFDCNGDDYFHPAPAAGSYPAEHWNLGAPFNRAVQGCSFASGLLIAGDPVTSTATVPVPDACAGRWYAGMAFLPTPPVSTDPGMVTWHNTSGALPDVDVCWYASASPIRCDRVGKDASGTVPAGATQAIIALRAGVAATFVLSSV